MKLKQASIFNLIEIFGQPRATQANTFSTASHCEQKYHHDFYCDAEKPFVPMY